MIVLASPPSLVSAAKPFDFGKEHDRLLAVSTIVHASDLGAQTLPTGIAKVRASFMHSAFMSTFWLCVIVANQ